MMRMLCLGVALLALQACEPVGQGIEDIGSAISREAENPRNERPN